MKRRGREEKKRGMLIRKAQITYLLYTARRLFLPRGPHPSFQTKSAITPRSRRTPWAAGRPEKSGRLGGISALRARTIFRLSLRKCQPEREQNMSKRTPSASGSRPWSRGEGERVVGAVLCAVCRCSPKSFCVVLLDSAGRTTSLEQSEMVHEAYCDA